MGKLVFQITDAVGPAAKTFTVPDVQIARMIAAYQGPANVAVNGTATRAQVLDYLVKRWIDTAVEDVKVFEIASAQATALASVTPITPT